MTETPSDIPPDNPPPRYSPVLVVMAIIPIVGLAAALGLLLAESTARPLDYSETVARVGSLDQQVPDFKGVVLTTLDGQPVDLKSYRGRPVFINFWGTWCAPCIEELPELQEFAAAQGPDGAAVVAVNSSEPPDVIEHYFDDNGLGLPDIEFVLDPDVTVHRWFGVSRMPTTFLVDAGGVVRDVKYGAFAAARDLQAYLDRLQAAGTAAED